MAGASVRDDRTGLDAPFVLVATPSALEVYRLLFVKRKCVQVCWGGGGGGGGYP